CWVIDGTDPEIWQVSAGEIVATGSGERKAQTWLLTERDYTDFLLRFEFQLFRGTKSGVALRALPGETVTISPHRKGKPLQTHLERRHLEVNLEEDTSPSAIRTGALYWSAVAGAYRAPDLPPSLKPLGSWNMMEILLRG